MAENNLHSRNIVACIWDFDKTLIPGYMQTPLFERYKVDEKTFWEEVSSLPQIYKEKGINVSKDTVYLNHLLSYVRMGTMKGLNNAILRELGSELQYYPGLPEIFHELKELVRNNNETGPHDITLEHYIISTGLAEIIRGSSIATHVDGIYGCEFVESPLPPGFLNQEELPFETNREISQIGTMVDNTIKTRFIFEINKGSNKDLEIDVNAVISNEDRRIPINNMIYIADGPSDVPVFSVVKKNGGKTYAVYNPDHPEEFAQNDHLLQVNRIHAYGPADYSISSSTSKWIKMHVIQICKRIAKERTQIIADRVSDPPRHLHDEKLNLSESDTPQQKALFDEDGSS